MQTQTKSQRIQPNQIAELLYANFSNLMSEFYEMQSSFLSGGYKIYESIETANIILCFSKNTHLEILRQREKNLDCEYHDCRLVSESLNLSLEIIILIISILIPGEMNIKIHYRVGALSVVSIEIHNTNSMQFARLVAVIGNH